MIKCWVDTETSGLEIKKYSIIEIACTLENTETQESNSISLYIKPYRGERIDPEASKINGITDQMADGYADQTDVFKEFLFYLKTSGVGPDKEKAHFIAYNASFDVMFVKDWFELNGKDFEDYFYLPPLDAMQLVNFAIIPERQIHYRMKLEKLHKRLLGADYNSHHAMNDVLAMIETSRAAVKKIKEGRS